MLSVYRTQDVTVYKTTIHIFTVVKTWNPAHEENLIVHNL
jgi:hypothetical protein